MNLGLVVIVVVVIVEISNRRRRRRRVEEGRSLCLLFDGVIGLTGAVTGEGNKACGSVLTASKFRL
jgi:hypothetical protein